MIYDGKRPDINDSTPPENISGHSNPRFFATGFAKRDTREQRHVPNSSAGPYSGAYVAASTPMSGRETEKTCPIQVKDLIFMAGTKVLPHDHMIGNSVELVCTRI